MYPHTHVKITVYTMSFTNPHYSKCHNIFTIPHNDSGCILDRIRNPTGSCGPVGMDTYYRIQFWYKVTDHTGHIFQLGVFSRSQRYSLLDRHDFSLIGWQPFCLRSPQMPLAFMPAYTFLLKCVAHSLFSIRAWSKNSRPSTSIFHLCRGRLIPFFVGTLVSF